MSTYFRIAGTYFNVLTNEKYLAFMQEMEDAKKVEETSATKVTLTIRCCGNRKHTETYGTK